MEEMVSDPFLLDMIADDQPVVYDRPRQPDHPVERYDEDHLPCQTHENGTQTTVVVVGLLHGGNNVLADRLIVAGLAHILG